MSNHRNTLDAINASLRRLNRKPVATPNVVAPVIVVNSLQRSRRRCEPRDLRAGVESPRSAQGCESREANFAESERQAIESDSSFVTLRKIQKQAEKSSADHYRQHGTKEGIP
jgi:hypothetical protein